MYLFRGCETFRVYEVMGKVLWTIGFKDMVQICSKVGIFGVGVKNYAGIILYVCFCVHT